MSIDQAVGVVGQWQTWFAQHPLVFLLVIVWAFIWKGLALWHSARGSQPVWFFFLLIINTLGILEIIYLLLFRRRRRVF